MSIAVSIPEHKPLALPPTTYEQPAKESRRRVLLSIITPAYNEAVNLPLLHERLCQVCDTAGIDWEWIIVDDHSVTIRLL